MRRFAFAPLLLVAVALYAADRSRAQDAAVRYHFGDDARWSDPAFDDSAWPVAQNGLVPSRSRAGDHFLWVRLRVSVPDSRNGQMALHLDGLGVQPMAWQVFVNGQLLGGQGDFPPHPDPADPPISPVLTVPASLAPPGSMALIALREWHAPSFFESNVPSQPHAVLDDAGILTLKVRAETAEALLANGPEYALSALLALAGLALFVFWRHAGGREYLWAAIYLVSPLATGILSTGPVAARLSFHELTLAWAVVYAAGLIAEIEFMWALFGLRSRWLRALWHIVWVAVLVAEMSQAYFLQSPELQRICRMIIDAGIPAFDCILFPVCIREMFRPSGNRAIAAAQSLFEVIVLLATFGYSVHLTAGPLPLDLYNLSLMLISIAIAAMLFRRAWKAWKESSSLRVEFEAAREVQQQLVAPAGRVPGFNIQSVYAPAKQVGGDFFRVLPADDGSVLLVIGDVSGKGLKAAMTVSAIMGAVRGCPSRNPGEVLAYLNRVLFGQVSGFVTCSASRIASDGTMIHANAGNPAPYCGGKEMPVECGIPLGILAESSYPETQYQIAPGDQLAFVSDGVIEATSPVGELFGFDRTAAISTHTADQIAKAAELFGQEDDITVLTLARAASGQAPELGHTG